jgi:hypothetical protein
VDFLIGTVPSLLAGCAVTMALFGVVWLVENRPRRVPRFDYRVRTHACENQLEVNGLDFRDAWAYAIARASETHPDEIVSVGPSRGASPLPNW